VDSHLPTPVPQVQVGFEPESVFATHCPKIHAPTITTKESVAWKKEKKQEVVERIAHRKMPGSDPPEVCTLLLDTIGDRE
jgi:hypothetical protein